MSFLSRLFRRRKTHVVNNTMSNIDNIYSVGHKTISTIHTTANIPDNKHIIDELRDIVCIKNEDITLMNHKRDGVLFIMTSSDESKHFVKCLPIDIHDRYQAELDIIDQFNDRHHDNVMRYKLYHKTSDNIFIIAEFIEGVTLGEYIRDNKILGNDIIKILHKIAKGLQFVHECGIIHCDMKPENIMISADEVKIIDFDMSIVSFEDIIRDKIIGTIEYISPEVYDMRIYSRKTDIWGIGVIAYIMITKKIPCPTNTIQMETDIAIERFDKFRDINYKLLTISAKLAGISADVIDIISSMLSFRYDDRPEISDIINVLGRYI